MPIKEERKKEMVDVFEQTAMVDLSAADLRTILIALDNLPEDEQDLGSVVEFYNIKHKKHGDKKPNKHHVKSIKALRELLIQRLALYEIKFQKESIEELTPMLVKILRKKDEDEEYEEVE